MKKIQISASLLSANFLNLKDEIKKCEIAGVDSFHLDIIDGHLAPNISYGPPIISFIRKATKLPLDAHLMIDNPWLYLDDFIKCQVDIITLHAESYDVENINHQQIKTIPRSTKKINIDKLLQDINYIKNHNIKAGLTINPGTDVRVIENLIEKVDQILIMSVNPGFSGQKFLNEVLSKVKYLKNKFKGNLLIDGGINDITAPKAINAGIDILITASYLFGSTDYKKAINKLKS